MSASGSPAIDPARCADLRLEQDRRDLTLSVRRPVWRGQSTVRETHFRKCVSALRRRSACAARRRAAALTRTSACGQDAATGSPHAPAPHGGQGHPTPSGRPLDGPIRYADAHLLGWPLAGARGIQLLRTVHWTVRSATRTGVGWWVVRGSNPRHLRCKRSALPTELTTPPGAGVAAGPEPRKAVRPSYMTGRTRPHIVYRALSTSAR